MKKWTRFTTILFTVMTLSALMAHLFELPAKIDLPREDYQTVQGIYRGWSVLGIFEIGAPVLTLIWIFLERRRKAIMPYLFTALLCFVISLVVFFLFTFPANQATVNWTQLPGNWELLRDQWEYSHALRAVINLMGFISLVLGILKKERAFGT